MIEKYPFTSVELPMVVPFKITLVKSIGSPESFKYTNPLMVPVDCCAKDKLVIKKQMMKINDLLKFIVVAINNICLFLRRVNVIINYKKRGAIIWNTQTLR